MKPTKRTRKKKTRPSIEELPEDSSSIPLHMMSQPEKINIENMLAKALNEYKQSTFSKVESHKDITQLTSIIDEFLSAYTLIGYTLKDEQVIISNAKTSKDDSALADLLRMVFMNMAHNRP
jgi:hypothetical protein